MRTQFRVFRRDYHQVDVFRHENIRQQAETRVFSNPFDTLNDDSAKAIVCQDRDASMCAEGHESCPIVVIEMLQIHVSKPVNAFLCGNAYASGRLLTPTRWVGYRNFNIW